MPKTMPALADYEVDILERVIDPMKDTLPRSAARYFLSLKLPAWDEERVNELSAKAQANTLTRQEADELDSYLRIGAFLSIMKSKARRSLRPEGASR